MRDGLTLEVLVAADYDQVRKLWAAAGLPIKPNGRDSRAQFTQQIAIGTQTILGLRDGKRLIGVVVTTHDGRKGWINRLAIHPDYQRRGLARQLITAAEETLRQQGMTIIAALIEDWNKPSLALFQEAGYIVHDDIHYLTKRDSHDV
ncbi:MAG: GNAT family N-acetyltransferase [Chloroflexi bacterium]|nr:GNAT family N-acetyltransferase [Chloroflexota bacterium]